MDNGGNKELAVSYVNVCNSAEYVKLSVITPALTDLKPRQKLLYRQKIPLFTGICKEVFHHRLIFGRISGYTTE
jgi:hypothetical protein